LRFLSGKKTFKETMPMDIETGKKVVATLRKYPDEYAKLKMAVQLMIDQLNQLITD
jgi:hypothetical protein